MSMEEIDNAVNSAWMVVFGSSFPKEKRTGGASDIDEERVIEELVTAVNALEQYADDEALTDVLEKEVADDRHLPAPASAETDIREHLYDGDEFDPYVFKKMHEAIHDTGSLIEELAAAREEY